MRANHQAKAKEGRARAQKSLPSQRFEAGCRSGKSGEQRISEVGQNGGRHVDRFDGLEQTKDQAGEQNADTHGNPAHARIGFRLGTEAKP
jgi:hypothetical protein